MEKDFLQIEQIDNYLSGKLSDEERMEVNRLLAEDAQFRILFDEIETLREGIRKSGAKTTIEAKLEKLADLDENQNPFANETRKEAKQVSILEYFGRYKMAIAATITIVAVRCFAITTICSSSPCELFYENFTAYAITNCATRGEATQKLSGLAAAYDSYAIGQYSQAIGDFNASMSESTNLEKDKFYLGNAYLASGEAQKAVELFNEVIKEEGPLQILATWYMGLSYLKLDDIKNARTSFEKVVAADAEKSLEAKLILGDL